MLRRPVLAFLAISLIAALCVPIPLLAADRFLPIPNGGFESGTNHWDITSGDSGISAVTTEQANTGSKSLKVDDTRADAGSSVFSDYIDIDGAGIYELRGRVYPVSGSGLGMYVRLYDSSNNQIEQYLLGLSGDSEEWTSFTVKAYTTRTDAAKIRLWIHSYYAAEVTGYLDDMYFVKRDPEHAQPPWEGTYKIKPHETDKLTEADVVGPDGVVYPNWTKTGVQGGIPDVSVVKHLRDFGGIPNDGIDDSEALHQACVEAGDAGGGAVQLEAGIYDLDWPVTVRHNDVVLRGAGQEATTLTFRMAIPAGGVGFYQLEPNHHVGSATPLFVLFEPTGLNRMEMRCNGQIVREWENPDDADGNWFYRDATGWTLKNMGFPSGPATLTGNAWYFDGTSVTASLPINLDWSFNDTRLVPEIRGAITFQGQGWYGANVPLAADARRGTRTIPMTSVSNFSVGDHAFIRADATERWNALVRNECPHGIYRQYLFRIDDIRGNDLIANQPMRIEFPGVDAPYVQRIETIDRSGIENLTVVQTENLWIHSVWFYFGWECWARNVTARMCGRNPIYGYYAKWCEIRDCKFDDAWFKGGGGTAYGGWEMASDCLADGIETWNLRHAPLFQWAGAGNVIRNGVFHNSDAQWHSGWTNENLIEMCSIAAWQGNGSYGYGMWASPPEDVKHGPNGPRNVVYNCDVVSPKDSLWMGGMNENWLIMYNRFHCQTGPGVYAKDASFDHIIQGNHFIVEDSAKPMVQFLTPDCIGAELIDNTLYGGNGNLLEGIFVNAEVTSGNVTLPLDTNAPRPAPAVPSIYLWQNPEPTATPTPTLTPTPTPTTTPSPSPTPTTSPSPTPSPTATPALTGPAPASATKWHLY